MNANDAQMHQWTMPSLVSVSPVLCQAITGTDAESLLFDNLDIMLNSNKKTGFSSKKAHVKISVKWGLFRAS